MCVISGIVRVRLKIFDNAILNIFWTLIDLAVEENTSGAFITCAYSCAVLFICVWYSGSISINKSYFVPTNIGIAKSLRPYTCRYHSFTESSVSGLVRSNKNIIAEEPTEASGSMFMNSRCPPRSIKENIMSVDRRFIFLFRKFTPNVWVYSSSKIF